MASDGVYFWETIKTFNHYILNQHCQGGELPDAQRVRAELEQGAARYHCYDQSKAVKKTGKNLQQKKLKIKAVR